MQIRVLRLLAPLVVVAALVTAAACSSPTDLGKSGHVGMYQLNVQPCVDTAAPRPGWVNCQAIVYLSINTTVQSGYVSAYLEYPETGAYYTGEKSVSSSVPGNISIVMTNPYVSKCVTSYPTAVRVYDGRVGDQTAKELGSISVNVKSIC
ncbi:MAG TPA: hypothetical protein VFK16_09500 [Gemmatimonadaceae bacterium]|jgi:hypothetical protein|nr:hypothetical protein [Gemmatimonadaceae bacterium]